MFIKLGQLIVNVDQIRSIALFDDAAIVSIDHAKGVSEGQVVSESTLVVTGAQREAMLRFFGESLETFDPRHMNGAPGLVDLTAAG